MLQYNYIELFLKFKNILLVDFHDKSFTIKLPQEVHSCPACGLLKDAIHDYRLQKIKYISSHLFQYELFLRKRRYICYHCSKHFAEINPFLGRYQQTTNLLKQFIISKFSKMKSASVIAKEAGISISTALRLFEQISYAKPYLIA